jgi:tRNA dimethylallyltransferase
VRPLLICIVGPTAVGKTEFAIKVANEVGAEIISADSRQIYRGMTIGTAAPTAEERAKVKHHFIDFLDPSELYSAGDFEKEVLGFLTGYFEKHHVAVLVGGSGLYVKGVVDGFGDLPHDKEIRKTLNERLEKEGVESLAFELRILDPTSAAKMDLKNPQRVVRALEVCIVSGKPFSAFHSEDKAERSFDILQIGLEVPREELNARIAKRTKIMMQNGWVDEVKKLKHLSHCNSLRTVGYKDLIAYINGECSIENAEDRIVISTRQFAKRQMTWFKKDDRVVWFNGLETESAFKHCKEIASKYE